MRLRILVLLSALFLVSAVAQAHPMGNFSINHHSRIRLSAATVDIRYILDFAEIPTYQMFPGTNDTAIRRSAEDWIHRLHLAIDGATLPLTMTDLRSEVIPGAGGLPTLRVVLDLSVSWRGVGTNLHFKDDNFPERIGWKEIVVEGLAGWDRDRSNDLTNYPADLLSSAPDVTEVNLNIASVRPSSVSAQKPAVVDRRYSGDRLTSILTARDLPFRLILFGMGIAFVLGAMHALSPGHGKTLVAGYLVGNRGTARHALFLGGIVTLTHTAGVFALGLVTLFLSDYIVPERLYPWLGFLSGTMIVAIGCNLFRRRLSHLADDHHHSPGGHSHGVSDLPSSGLTFRSLLAMGVSGGIVPCPSALVVLLSAVALHRIQLGLLLIVAFSLGLASVLVSIGILVVRAGQWLSRFDSHHQAARILPVLSAILVTIIGLGIAAQSLAGSGVFAGGLSFSSGVIAVLGLGLVLGLKHATDADHVVAVTTFVSEEQSLLRSCWIGAFWGAGHTLSLAVAGLSVIFLKINISEWLAARLELLVALMLFVLGSRVLLQTLRAKLQLHTHQHTHAVTAGAEGHAHWHLHTAGEHSHFDWRRVGLRPLLVGIIHGAAGSAALMLLVLSTIRSPLEAFIYILVFGLGSIAGMLAISFLLALPLQWAKGRLATSYKPIQLTAGLFSCVFGLYFGVQIWSSLP